MQQLKKDLKQANYYCMHKSQINIYLRLVNIIKICGSVNTWAKMWVIQVLNILQ